MENIEISFKTLIAILNKTYRTVESTPKAIAFRKNIKLLSSF